MSAVCDLFRNKHDEQKSVALVVCLRNNFYDLLWQIIFVVSVFDCFITLLLL